MGKEANGCGQRMRRERRTPSVEQACAGDNACVAHKSVTTHALPTRACWGNALFTQRTLKNMTSCISHDVAVTNTLAVTVV